MASKPDAHPADARSLDAVFDLLRNHRRRFVVRTLAERDGPVGGSELAMAVARQEFDDSNAAPAEASEGVDAALHHVHLPKLADAGLVAYESETGTVVPTRLEAVDPFPKAADAITEAG